MNLPQRCQAVFEAGYKLGTTSFRALAAATKLSKSSVHRLYQRIQRRNQYPESPLWETQAGQQWLRLLVFAALFVFTLEGGIGCFPDGRVTSPKKVQKTALILKLLLYLLSRLKLVTIPVMIGGIVNNKSSSFLEA